MAERTEHRERAMTTAMLKALANPLRRRILRTFGKREFLRAADIAEDLGEPPNKVSFHLRVLADAGLIAEAPEHARDARDRVWTPIKESLTLRSSPGQEEDVALGNAFIAALAEDHDELVRRVVAYSLSAASMEDPHTHASLMVSNLHLTESEYLALRDTLSQAIVAAEETHDRTAPDSRLWQIDIVAADDRI